MKQGKAVPSCHHAEQSELDLSAVAASCVCLNSIRTSGRAQRASTVLLPVSAGFRLRSGVQRTETDGVRLVRGGSLRGWCMVPRRRPRRAGTSIVAGARVPAPSRAVCHRLVWGAGAALCGVCCRRHETKHAPPNSLPAERGRRLRRARAAVPQPVSRLRCAGNAVKWSRSLRSEKRNGVDVPAQVVESGPTSQPVPRWCA